MAEPAIQAVIFDIGNVLIRWNPDAFYDRTIGSDRRHALFAAVPLAEMNLRVDRGADLHSEVEALAEAHPDWADDIRLWESHWLEMAAPAIDRSVRLLRALRRRGHKVFALSNFGTKTFTLAEANYPFLEEFDQRFISGHLEVLKPEPEIYAHVEAETGIAPEAMLFIDDSAANIAAAAERGWQVHHFEGASGLAQRLVAEGLLDKEDAE